MTQRKESHTRIRKGPPQVLLVGRGSEERDAIEAALAREGNAVDSCASDVEARQWIAARLPDVVVIDLERGRGQELARSLRAESRTAHLALIATTGEVEPDWEVVRFFDAYLRTPVDVELLTDLIDKLADTVLRAAPTRDGRTPAFR